MAEKIDMSLDDIIKMDKISGNKKGRSAAAAAGGPKRGGGRTAGNRRGFAGGNRDGNRDGNRGVMRNARNYRSAPYSMKPKMSNKWQHDMYEGASSDSYGSNHLLISNLDFGVSDKDIRDLFEEFGPIKKAAVNYDRSGRSLGTAYVIFATRNAGAAAMKKYNGVLLDGRTMRISAITSPNSEKQSTGQTMSNQNRPRKRTNIMDKQPNRKPMARNKPRKSLTAEELDADLEAFSQQRNV